MKERHRPADQPPRREELAAYFDGELTGARRRQLEEWLIDHPHAQADLEDWRHLADEWRSTGAHDPGAKAWDGMLARIETATRRRVWPRRVATLVAAVAASLLVAFALNRPGPAEADHEPLVLAAPADVEIISIDAADVQALVVGQPPLHEPLVLAESADIDVEHIEPDHDGSVPSVRWWAGVEAPMIVATATPER
jgi:anti-sigma factor RsiW